MKPGTYRIVNLKSGTAIAVNHLGTVGWHIEDSKSQKFVQHSGEGYRFKNSETGGYLAAVFDDDLNNRVYCSGYPTTWVLVPNPAHRGHGIYGIIIGETDRVVDLTGWGNATDGTKLYVVSRTEHTGSTQHMAWKFEYLKFSDEMGEESPSLSRAQEALAREQQTVRVQAHEIKLLREFLLASREEIARLTSQ
ncbi:unnamed protein product, partial [Rhizoctonia solani]